jgi:hypothetical protein
MAIYLVVAKLVSSEFALTNRPAFFFALTFLILGMQLFLAGYIAELVARNAPGRNHYLIESKIGL